LNASLWNTSIDPKLRMVSNLTGRDTEPID